MTTNPDELLDLTGLVVCRYLLAHQADYATADILVPPTLNGWLHLLCFAQLPARFCADATTPSWRAQVSWPYRDCHAEGRPDLATITSFGEVEVLAPAGVELLARYPHITACLAGTIDWLAARLPLFDEHRFCAYVDLARLWTMLREANWNPPADLDQALHLAADGSTVVSQSEPGRVDSHDAACWANLHRLHQALEEWLAPQMAKLVAAPHTASPTTTTTT